MRDGQLTNRQLIQRVPDRVLYEHYRMLKDLKRLYFFGLPICVSLLSGATFFGVYFFQKALAVDDDIKNLTGAYAGRYPVPSMQLALMANYCQFEKDEVFEQCDTLTKLYEQLQLLNMASYCCLSIFIGYALPLVLFAVTFSKEAFIKLAAFNSLSHFMILAGEEEKEGGRTYAVASTGVGRASSCRRRTSELSDAVSTTVVVDPPRSLPRPCGLLVTGSEQLRAGQPPMPYAQKLLVFELVTKFYIRSYFARPDVLHNAGQNSEFNKQILEHARLLGNLSCVNRDFSHMVEAEWCGLVPIEMPGADSLVRSVIVKKRVYSLMVPVLNAMRAKPEDNDEFRGFEKSPMMALARLSDIESSEQELAGVLNMPHLAVIFHSFFVLWLAFSICITYTTSIQGLNYAAVFHGLWEREVCGDDALFQSDCGRRGRGFLHSDSYALLSDFCRWACDRHNQHRLNIDRFQEGLATAASWVLLVGTAYVVMATARYYFGEKDTVSDLRQTLFGKKAGRIQLAERVNGMLERQAIEEEEVVGANTSGQRLVQVA